MNLAHFHLNLRCGPQNIVSYFDNLAHKVFCLQQIWSYLKCVFHLMDDIWDSSVFNLPSHIPFHSIIYFTSMFSSLIALQVRPFLYQFMSCLLHVLYWLTGLHDQTAAGRDTKLYARTKIYHPPKLSTMISSMTQTNITIIISTVYTNNNIQTCWTLLL